jgi:hypothetical protein
LQSMYCIPTKSPNIYSYSIPIPPDTQLFTSNEVVPSPTNLTTKALSNTAAESTTRLLRARTDSRYIANPTT